MAEPLLRLQGIQKDFGEGPILKNLSLDVYPGEFLTLLGPSGCGKTTTLRIIAGLETPNAGQVLLDGADMTAWPPEKRPVNTVFQNYALFPHMNVFQNIAYGLRIQKISKQEQRERVMAALSLVRLSGYEKRMPSQLSGGQRQRVAIARAVVLQPKILLLDEPLGALDLKLRQEMQKELKLLQQQLGITFIYITHDQEEALNMSSRIVIMREGEIEQVGTPADIYERPRTLFAADFIGQSNLIHATVEKAEKDLRTLDADGVHLPPSINGEYHPAIGDKVVLCLRPQRIRYGTAPQHNMEIKGVIVSKDYTGGMQHTQIMLGDNLTISAVGQSAEMDSHAVGSDVYVGWSIRHAPVVPDTQEEA